MGMADSNKGKQRGWGYLLQIALSLAIVVVLVVPLNPGRFAGVFSDLRWGPLWGAAGLLVVSLGVRAWRWRLLFEDGAHRISFPDAMWLLLAGAALNLVLPASSGDVVKGYFGYRWSGVKERMLSISVVDKVIALGSVGLLGALAALAQGQWVYGLLSACVLVPSVMFLALPRLMEGRVLWERLLRGVTRLVRGKVDFVSLMGHVELGGKRLVPAIVLSVVGWLITYVQLYLCFRAAGAWPALGYVYMVAPLITLVRLFPLTLGGVGSDEAAIYFFFRPLGLSFETVLAAALLYRGVALLLPGVIGLAPLAFKRHIGGASSHAAEAFGADELREER